MKYPVPVPHFIMIVNIQLVLCPNNFELRVILDCFKAMFKVCNGFEDNILSGYVSHHRNISLIHSKNLLNRSLRILDTGPADLCSEHGLIGSLRPHCKSFWGVSPEHAPALIRKELALPEEQQVSDPALAIQLVQIGYWLGQVSRPWNGMLVQLGDEGVVNFCLLEPDGKRLLYSFRGAPFWGSCNGSYNCQPRLPKRRLVILRLVSWHSLQLPLILPGPRFVVIKQSFLPSNLPLEGLKRRELVFYYCPKRSIVPLTICF
mmetsp:Transcript_24984/g.39246  ORF Transcript_24984/g.39246 Transcript_24984/m.39246 type:complete len:261 (-) Transcript_24984:564-1346(-)